MGGLVGEALRNFLSRIVVLVADAQHLRAVGAGGLRVALPMTPLSALPATAATLAGPSARSLVYGAAAADPRAAELGQAFGFGASPTALLATIASGPRARLLVYADNGPSADIYEELHDIELLMKEAETALSMLEART